MVIIRSFFAHICLSVAELVEYWYAKYAIFVAVYKKYSNTWKIVPYSKHWLFKNTSNFGCSSSLFPPQFKYIANSILSRYCCRKLLYGPICHKSCIIVNWSNIAKKPWYSCTSDKYLFEHRASFNFQNLYLSIYEKLDKRQAR